MLKISNLIGFAVGGGNSTVLDITYADDSTGTHDLATGPLVLAYQADKVHRVTPRSSIVVDVELWGGGGGSAEGRGGAAAKVDFSDYTMVGGTEYAIAVGEGGQNGTDTNLAGGWPDGGAHQGVTYNGEDRGSGGGSSRFAVTSSLVSSGTTTANLNDASSTYLAIAGAGGGGPSRGGSAAAVAGEGGAITGVAGGTYVSLDGGGGGGTQSAGGAGGVGRTGTGGSGAKYAGGDSQSASDNAAGTGGGGYYGGGSGGGYYGAGGGGSSFLDGSLTGNKTSGSGLNAPSGQPAGYPNAGDAVSGANAGENGVVTITLAS